MKQFKVGDKVYSPKNSNKILLVGENKSGSENYPLAVGGFSFTTDGKHLTYDKTPSVFHATSENHELLTKLYGMEFEAPTVKSSSREIIQAMLASGYHGVLCRIAVVDEDDDNIVYCYSYDYALEVLEDKISFSNRIIHNDQLNLVSPFHQKEGMEIVDFVNGKIVLQNGEVILAEGIKVSF